MLKQVGAGCFGSFLMFAPAVRLLVFWGRRLRCAAAVFLVLCLAVPAFGAEQKAIIRVGCLTYSPPWYDGAFVDETLSWLRWKLPQYDLQVSFYDAAGLQQAILDRKVDLVFSSSAVYYRNIPNGLRDLAVLISNTARNPNASAAAAVIVRADSTVRQLQDLRDKTVAAVLTEPSPGLYEVQSQIASQHLPVEKILAREDIRPMPALQMRSVVENVLSGKVDAGIVRACFLQDLVRSGALKNEVAKLRVVDPVRGDGLACPHSTKAYPGWVAASGPGLSWDAARVITANLLAMPENSWDQYWGTATDFTSVDQMYKTLKQGPYSYLREGIFQHLWREYRSWVVVAVLALLMLLGYSVLLESLVRRRTRQLELINAEQRRSEQKAQEATSKLDRLQRLGVVGQMSSIVAHEVKQPLSAIENLSRGGERLLEDEPLDPEELATVFAHIHDEAVRADRIVERVRSYGRGKKEKVFLDLSDVLSRCVSQFQASAKGKLASIRIIYKEQIKLYANAVDMELIFFNLLANAAESASASRNPHVEVLLAQVDGCAVYEVADNGPRLNDEMLKRLSDPMVETTKQTGLGLGLMIVKSLVESYVGRLRFYRNGSSGVRAQVQIPLEQKLANNGNGNDI